MVNTAIIVVINPANMNGQTTIFTLNAKLLSHSSRAKYAKGIAIKNAIAMSDINSLDNNITI